MSARRPLPFAPRAAARALLLATVSAALLLGAAAVRAEQPLGRLFFTPAERQQLDRLRPSTSDGHSLDAQALTVNGLVLRSSGRHTAWINGVAQDADASRFARAAGPQAPERLTVGPPHAAAASVRAGETIGPAHGELRGLPGDGSIVIHRHSSDRRRPSP
ncbi:hypothetical protein [Rhodocyclus purpureus]|uniref:hypothetical protein n=1 Tax=Rhodocyclus purpureus TaxID=1067 RepID=UPI0019131884|nr:hypothetical protein [Rhodocyclus purpureus]MBK5913493.1 hypothetical protein [Rhodocyclus purpureus]